MFSKKSIFLSFDEISENHIRSVLLSVVIQIKTGRNMWYCFLDVYKCPMWKITMNDRKKNNFFPFCEGARVYASINIFTFFASFTKKIHFVVYLYDLLFFILSGQPIHCDSKRWRKSHDDVYLMKSSMLHLRQFAKHRSGSELVKRTRSSWIIRAGYCTDPWIHPPVETFVPRFLSMIPHRSRWISFFTSFT